jgi:hypothetical protein
MAEVTVFVDDAVRGRLPDICAKDGVPAAGRLRIIEEIGRSNRIGILWLLVFLGPPGWLVIFLLIGSSSSGEHLSVEIPYSDGAYERFASARRLKNTALVAGALGGIFLLLLTAWAGLGLSGLALVLGVALVAFVGIIVGETQLGRASVGVRLDASRRWVTLRRVHPAFVSACAEQERQRTPTAR